MNPNLKRPSALESKPRAQDSLWLDKNENLDSKLLTITAEVLELIPKTSIATYPEAGELYRKLSKWVDVEPTALLLTPGSDGAIRLTFEAFIEDKDFVLHTTPTFAMYHVYSQMFGASEIETEYTSVNGKPFLDVAKVLKLIREHQPKLVCLPNPDSPTGTIISKEDLQKILTACEEFECILLVDEAYHPFYELSVVPWTKTSKNLLVARTFAKAWGAAGLRIGYLVGNPETITLIHKMRPMYEVSTVAIEFITIMLDKVSEMQSSVLRIQKGKTFFQHEMRKLDYDVLETEGNFIHVGFKGDQAIINGALAGHVLYRGTSDHISLAGYSRFTAAPVDVMSKVVDFIKEASSKRLIL
jgi:histidinol-phosphate aminotransferase